ncbi:MAG TPA: CHAT domain-containing protein [Caulobacteraceae bacterium]|nr:CHAT domain-containing protein [Caulobacteraceae bacterium]
MTSFGTGLSTGVLSTGVLSTGARAGGYLALILAVMALAPSAGAWAAVRYDSFPLGQSAKTGAVCEAAQDDQDPAAQARGATAWAVTCRGWQGVLGRLYLYERDGDAAIAADGPWRQALRGRADCQQGKPLSLAGLSGTLESQCASARGGTAYLAYTASRGKSVVTAEGLAPLADLLQVGLRVAAGVIKPPVAMQSEAAAIGGGSSTVSLADAADQVQRAPDLVRERAYVQNQAWQFADAETAFRALALDAAAAPHDRAEAYLNWALNASNLGRFDEADDLFAQADAQAALVKDPELDALELNYRALHARNRRDFPQTIALAQRALTQRALVRQRGASALGAELASGSSNEIYISPALADALNRRARNQSILGQRGLTEAQKLTIQDAQAVYLIGSSQAAMGDAAAARRSLEDGRSRLTDPTLVKSAGWLRAQVDAELARLELKSGDVAAAKSGLADALKTLRGQTGLSGSQTEAALLLEYARAEAASGEVIQALADYDRGFALFRDARGSLGASADAADAYLDLLIKQRERLPAQARAYDERFFTAVQSVVSEATADTVARLSARLNAGGGASAGIARALDDTRRRIHVQESAIQDAQDAKTYTGAAKAQGDAQLKALNAEASALEAQLLAANPRYGQLVIATASLDQMQKALNPGEAYVKIVLLGARGYGLMITRDTVRPYAVPLGRVSAETLVARLRKPFDTANTLPRFDVALAHEAYQTLFGPVSADMAKVDHLVFDPDGALISFPVAALVIDQASADTMAARLTALRAKGGGVLSYAGVDWLGRNTDTSLVVSAASFLESRAFAPSTAPNPYLGFGDAVIGSADNPRLFASVLGQQLGAGKADFCESQRQAMAKMRRLTETATEVREVGQSLGAPARDEVLGAAFSDADIKARTDLDQYRVLYFATHGLLPQPGECLPQPALVTSLGDGDSDGLLDAVEILDLKLNADLVVLSACNTGAPGAAGGGLTGTGEALGGLTRAFIYAGSRGLVVSHWEVDSRSALALMTGMFSGAGTKGSISQSGALRRSELAMMDSDAYSHPYYWAAFTVVGDGARPLPVGGLKEEASNGH